jgi:hypothetical protein
MDTERKRQIIMQVYKSDSWRRKVLTMSQPQVIAVYLRFLKEGKV